LRAGSNFREEKKERERERKASKVHV